MGVTTNIDIDSRINYAEEYSKYIRNAKIKGNQLIGNCPIHKNGNEKNPSFVVNTDNPLLLRSSTALSTTSFVDSDTASLISPSITEIAWLIVCVSSVPPTPPPANDKS